MNGLRRSILELEPQISKPDEKLYITNPLASTALMAAWQCLYCIGFCLQTVGGILVLFAVTLAGAVCTVLLIRATRGATLRQIQASLLALSEQFDALPTVAPGRPVPRRRSSDERIQRVTIR